MNKLVGNLESSEAESFISFSEIQALSYACGEPRNI